MIPFLVCWISYIIGKSYTKVFFVTDVQSYCLRLLSVFLITQKERRKIWDEKNQEEIAKAVKILYDFDQVIQRC